MSNFDNDIRQALQAEGDNLEHAGDEGLMAQVTASFRSRMRHWVALIWAASFVVFGMAVFAAVSFFRAETTRDWILYATIFAWAMFAVGMLKMWYWMELNRNTHTREIKRLEIQLARLADRLEREEQ